MSNEIYEHVAKKIATLRKERGLSQEQLSLDSDLNKAYIGHIERGYKKPSIETLQKICKNLDVHISDILKDV